MSTTTPADKPPRKFPPPCWTQEEALALIEAYRERWYALRRGYLRTADWDAVAAAVGVRCPDASPAKTSAQCRHKMEKLRQRYRAEKQRSLSYPGRFFSSWFFFDSMDAMENGSNQQTGQNSASIGLYSKNSKKIEGDSNPSHGFDHEALDPVVGFRVKAVSDRNSVPLGFRSKKSSPNIVHRVSNGHSPYLDFGSDEDADERTGFGVGNLVPPGYRENKSEKIYRNLTPKFEPIHSEDDAVDVGSGFRAKKYSKIDWDESSYNRIDSNGEIWVKVPSDRNSVPSGFRGKSSGSKTDRNSNPNLDPRVLNGYSSPSRSAFGKMMGGGGGGGGGGGVKRGRGPVAEMVSSIKLLGEGFMKMEKMKMEMAKDIEKMRMEMEMKRNELLVESQQQIVDAFVKGLFENKKKVKPAVSPDS